MASAKTLFPNRVTFRGTGLGLEQTFLGDAFQPTELTSRKAVCEQASTSVQHPAQCLRQWEHNPCQLSAWLCSEGRGAGKAGSCCPVIAELPGGQQLWWQRNPESSQQGVCSPLLAISWGCRQGAPSTLMWTLFQGQLLKQIMHSVKIC